jgi:hypothetical protein
MESNAHTDVDKLITFGQMALEQGWYEQACEYFEQALALDASNREAMKGLARINEILSRREAIVPTKPEVPVAKPAQPARPQRAGEPTAKREGKKRWVALAVVIPVLLLILLSVAYQRAQVAQREAIPTPQVDYARVYETQAAQREATRAARVTPILSVISPTATPIPPTPVPPTPTLFNAISFTDQISAVEVEILQILIGNQVVENAKLYSLQLEDAREQGKDVVYFEVSVENQKFDGEITVLPIQFKLESTKGDTFSADLTRDYIHGRIHRGRSTRGGISFEIYPDTVPKLLRYDTTLIDGLGRKLEAISPNLEKYFQ